MKRIFVILLLAQVLAAGLYIIHLKRMQLNEGYLIGDLVEEKQEKLISLDEEIYFVEKIKNPKNILQKSAELGLQEKPGDKKYYEHVYLNPEERVKKVKEFQETVLKPWKTQLAERENWIDIE